MYHSDIEGQIRFLVNNAGAFFFIIREFYSIVTSLLIELSDG